MSVPSTEECVLCGVNDESLKNSVGPKGLKTMKQMCMKKGEKELHQKLKQLEDAESKISVHINCRKRLTDPRSCEIPVPIKRTRSCIDHIFDWKEDCFLCEKKLDVSHEKNAAREAMTIKLCKIVLERAKERGDEWGIKVLAKIESCIDLVAKESVYHSSCMAEFRLNKENRRPTACRPINSEMVEVFQKLCNLLENSMDCEIYSVIELDEKMSEFQ